MSSAIRLKSLFRAFTAHMDGYSSEEEEKEEEEYGGELFGGHDAETIPPPGEVQASEAAGGAFTTFVSGTWQ